MTRPEWRWVCRRCGQVQPVYIQLKTPPVCWNHKGTRGETMILEHELKEANRGAD